MAETKQNQKSILEELSQLRTRVAELEQSLAQTEAYSPVISKDLQFYQTLLENLPSGFIFVFDQDLRYVIVDGAGLLISKDTIEGKPLKDLVSPQSYELISYHYRLALQGQETAFEINSGEKTFMTRVRPLRDKHHSIFGGIAMVQDITEQKRAQEQVRQNEARYRAVSEITSDFVWAASATSSGQYKLDWVTDAVENVTGYIATEFEELGGVGGLCLEEDLPTLLSLRQHIATGKAKKIELECRITCKNKQIRWLHISGFPIFNNEQVTGLLAAATDITEHKRIEAERQGLEHQLQIVQKLESLGVLAGGLAHDFNNLLSVILGNLSLAQTALSATSSDPDIINSLQEVEKASFRAIGLTRQLLTFAKGGTPVRKTAQLREIIEDSARFMVSGSRATLDFKIEPNLAEADVDTDQLSQVIQNLVLNAVQAMPDGGRIQINAHNVRLHDEEVATLVGGSYIQISVQDEGTGISPENLAKIFDPFFTTKVLGSGLGLAMVFSIIRQHEGYIQVQSEQGEGTCFILYLPASNSSAPLNKENIPAPAQTVPASTGRILIMDDEPSIRHTVSRLLTYLGYSCEVAADGLEALQLYREAMANKHPFTVVILDLTVPNGMGGEETVRQILKNDPKAKVIVSSGYSEDPIMANFRKYGFSGIASKPYRLKELQQVLDEVIAKPENKIARAN